MGKLQKRWHEEFLEKTHYSAEGMRKNASRFKKERKAEIYKIYYK